MRPLTDSTVADRRAAAVEALAILDASMVLGAEPRDFLIRADPAVRADLPFVLLETARTAATILAQRVAAADPAAGIDGPQRLVAARHRAADLHTGLACVKTAGPMPSLLRTPGGDRSPR